MGSEVFINYRSADAAFGGVRYEIRRAVERAVPIVPVLLDDTALPDPAVLPPDIRRLAYHQTAEVWHQHLGVDVERLASRIADLLPAGRHPDIATGRLVPQQLPADSGWFVGREQQLAELDVLLGWAEQGRANVVVISGTRTNAVRARRCEGATGAPGSVRAARTARRTTR